MHGNYGRKGKCAGVGCARVWGVRVRNRSAARADSGHRASGAMEVRTRAHVELDGLVRA